MFNDTLLLGQCLNMIPLIATQLDKKDVLEQRWRASWWVRSTYIERDNVCYIVSGSGSFLNVDATDSYYIAFGLCL